MSSTESEPSSKCDQKTKKTSKSVVSCMMTPNYPTTYSQYAVISPVLLPYVQAPVQYIKKDKSKNSSATVSSSSGKIRYIPAYTYTPLHPQYICYNKHCLSQVNADGGTNLVQRLGLPYAMRINPEARSLNQGYVSALTPPAAYLTNCDADLLSRTDLNPLSRPYTPPSRLKQCTCRVLDNNSEDEKSTNDTPLWIADSYCESCEGTIGESRIATPFSLTTTKWSNKSDTNLSDTDSGVEGGSEDSELDEEDEWLAFRTPDKSETTEAPEERRDSVNELELKFYDLAADSLPTALTDVIDFLCQHLDSHEWRTVAREMGVNDVLIQSVDYDFYDSFRDQMKYVFTCWANLQKSDTISSSCGQAKKALGEIGRTDLVELLSGENVTQS